MGKRDSLLGSLSGSVGYGYGTLFGNRSQEVFESEDGEEESGWRVWTALRDVWIKPKQGAVRRVVDRWWLRWAVLFFLPAAIVGQPTSFYH